MKLNSVKPHGDFATELEIFFGEASDTVCHVYAQLSGGNVEPGLQLSGMLTGPHCEYAETLTANFKFSDRGPGKSLLAMAVVPEPCFWTPEMPQLYQAHLQLKQGDQLLAEAQRSFGLRTLGAQGRNFVYDGKRWVLRGVSPRELPPTELAAWRDSDMVMLIHNPDEALASEASRVGVLLAAELDAADAAELRRLSRHAAIAFVVLPGDWRKPAEAVAHNLILTQRFGRDESIVPAKWAKAILCETDQPEALADQVRRCHLPVIALRPAGRLATLAEARQKCDLLQRDLAGRGSFAGYAV